jgi:hypothetical protein
MCSRFIEAVKLAVIVKYRSGATFINGGLIRVAARPASITLFFGTKAEFSFQTSQRGARKKQRRLAGSVE